PFAAYFVKYLQAYAQAGLPVDYISLQNEPLFVPADYPGMLLPTAAELTVLRDAVLPALAQNHLAARVLVYDHNWDRPDYPDTVFGDASVLAAPQVAGVAWHGYGGTAGIMTPMHNKYPAMGNYETEHSGGTFIGDQVRSDFEDIIQTLRNWGRSYVKWSLALDQNRGPHLGGCGTCTPLVTVNTATGAVDPAIEYYTLGQFSKYVLPGATRVFSSNGAGLLSVAFLNPDGSRALVAFNEAGSANVFSVQWGTQSFTYTLAALSGATFTWSGTPSGTATLDGRAVIQAASSSRSDGPRTGSIQSWGLTGEASSDTPAGFDLGGAVDGDYAVYKKVDFSTGVSGIKVRLACAPAGNCGGQLLFRLDRVDGAQVAAVTIPNTGGWQQWQTVTAAANGAAGVHDLYLVYQAATPGAAGLGNVGWFQFQ
ncbi:MAG: carbohydrate-binding protein, partial [Terriglobales bacterium]